MPADKAGGKAFRFCCGQGCQGTWRRIALFQNMPRFFFHIRDSEPIDDPDGMYLPDTRTARLEAVRSARDIMAEDVRRGRLQLSSCIEVTDENGEAIFALPFREAIDIEQ